MIGNCSCGAEAKEMAMVAGNWVWVCGYGKCNNSPKITVSNSAQVITPKKGEPMPKTIDHYQALAARDLELIMEQREEIARLKQTVNQLRQRKDKS